MDKDGAYLPHTAGEQVRLTAYVIEFWRERHMEITAYATITQFLRNACDALRYWQWQAWRGK